MIEEHPRLTEIKGGWAAHGDGWAVHGATKDEAQRLFTEAQKRHQEIAKQPLFCER